MKKFLTGYKVLTHKNQWNMTVILKYLETIGAEPFAKFETTISVAA
jgi:hypothetical protein